MFTENPSGFIPDLYADKNPDTYASLRTETDKEIEEEKKNRASKELEKKFSTIRESSVFSVPIKDAAMDTLSKCNLPNQRVEVLLRLIQRKNEEEIKDTLKMRGLNRSLTEKERALVSGH